MQTIKGILFEPVGCLAEFPPGRFRSYWHLLNLGGNTIEALETEAVDGAVIYDDVLPALAELKAMGIKLMIASSLSQAAVGRFLAKCPHEFDGVWSQHTAGGAQAATLMRALEGGALRPENAIFITDTAEGLRVAESVGVNSVLMMNDPDESRRLAMLNPGGGIVSMHELPDFIRLVQARNGETAQAIESGAEESAWDEEIIRDFGPGGRGERLANEILREIGAGHARSLEEDFAKRRRSDS